MFEDGSYGSRWSSAAVEGRSWRSPCAPAVERAFGWSWDSTWATATSSASGRFVSSAAETNAARNRSGIGQVTDLASAGWKAPRSGLRGVLPAVAVPTYPAVTPGTAGTTTRVRGRGPLRGPTLL